MVFKAKELPRLNKFIQEIVKEYPIYNQTMYFSKLMEIYKSKYRKWYSIRITKSTKKLL